MPVVAVTHYIMPCCVPHAWCRVFFFGGQERERYFTAVERQADIDKWFNPDSNTSLDQPILNMYDSPDSPNVAAAEPQR